MAIPILPADILKSKFEELFLEVLLGLHIAENFQNIQKFKKYLHRTWLEALMLSLYQFLVVLILKRKVYEIIGHPTMIKKRDLLNCSELVSNSIETSNTIIFFICPYCQSEISHIQEIIVPTF